MRYDSFEDTGENEINRRRKNTCTAVTMDRMILVLLALTCAFQTVRCQLDPEIVDEIIPEVTKQGGSARINCTVVNKQDGHTVVWNFMDSRSGGEIISNDENIVIDNPSCKEGYLKYEVTKREVNKRMTYMLVVNCLELVDYGYYKCYIRIRVEDSSQWPSKIAYLVVQVSPTITSKNDAVVQLYEGDDATLTCTANGVPRPNITWVRSDGGLLPNGRGALLRNKSLEIKKVSKQDRGLFKCIADNQVRPKDTYLVAINVFFKPETIATQDTVGQAQNRHFKAILECRVSGYPEPEVVWYREPTAKDGTTELQQLNDDEDFEITKMIATTSLRFGESWYKLTIKNVLANHYTNYYCVAKNSIGVNDTTVIKLFETMECQGSLCPTQDAKGSFINPLPIVILCLVALFTKLFFNR